MVSTPKVPAKSRLSQVCAAALSATCWSRVISGRGLLGRSWWCSCQEAVRWGATVSMRRASSSKAASKAASLPTRTGSGTDQCSSRDVAELLVGVVADGDHEVVRVEDVGQLARRSICAAAGRAGRGGDGAGVDALRPGGCPRRWPGRGWRAARARRPAGSGPSWRCRRTPPGAWSRPPGAAAGRARRAASCR